MSKNCDSKIEKRNQEPLGVRVNITNSTASTLINVDSSVLNEPSRLDKRSSSSFRDRI